MTDSTTPFRTPYTSTPGSSTPSPEVAPAEGHSELISFVWLSFVSTAIIVVVGLVAWRLVH